MVIHGHGEQFVHTFLNPDTYLRLKTLPLGTRTTVIHSGQCLLAVKNHALYYLSTLVYS